MRYGRFDVYREEGQLGLYSFTIIRLTGVKGVKFIYV